MKIKSIIIVLVFLFVRGTIFAQGNGNAHTKLLHFSSDTVQLDTLSLVPGSFLLSTPGGQLLDTSLYRINYVTGQLILYRAKMKQQGIASDSLNTFYKTFPYLFSEETKHKDVERVKADLSGKANPFSYNIEGKNDDIFKMDGLNKTGSISRGVTFGNNQDVVVN